MIKFIMMAIVVPCCLIALLEMFFFYVVGTSAEWTALIVSALTFPSGILYLLWLTEPKQKRS